MASLFQRDGGWSVDVMVPGHGRRRINLGKVSRADARRLLARIESIAAAVAVDSRLRPDDESFLRELSPDLLERIERTGLLDGTGLLGRVTTFNAWSTHWLDHYELYQRSVDRFSDFLGRSKLLGSVSRDDAASFVHGLREEGLAEATVHQHVRHLKACFNAARNRDLIAFSPFDRIPSASRAAERTRFVSREEAMSIFDHLPTDQHRAVFVLARFAGFRVSSESHGLLWEDVDLSRRRLRVYAQKTSRWRDVPIVPEVADVLCLLPDREGRVVTVSTNNLARTLENAAVRAGVEPWKRPFQVLRQSCETDLNDRFPVHVVASWLGHSVAVAQKHYLQVTAEHFEQAAICSRICSTSATHDAKREETTGVGDDQPERHKALQGNTLRNSPARIRTGDRAIMSRQL